MQLPKLVIASILKPIDDTRMYEKFGKSISQTNKYEVNIIGFLSKNKPLHPEIKFHSLFNFNRLSIKRVVAPILYLRKLLSIKPELIIITTHELIWATLFYKLLFGARVIYDIRENYYLNIRHTDAFPAVLKTVIASYVRFKEKISKLFISHFILAERCYLDQLDFLSNKFTIIENKATSFINDTMMSNIEGKKSNTTTLLFSGTLAETTGVFEAIDLAINLNKLDPDIHLKIIGYSSKFSTLKKLNSKIENYSFIELIGGDNLVPHATILEAILSSDFGIIYYPKNSANDGAIPTKLFEYIHAQLPILTDEKSQIITLCKKYPAAIYIDFTSYNPEEILKKMNDFYFYKITPNNEVLWVGEELKLLQLINS